MTIAWDDARTAELYAQFTRDYPMYHETSADLVRLADIANAKTIVDLACGTGVTTQAVLNAAPPDATVVAIDSSSAMLDIAKRDVTDQRVRFVLANASDVADHVENVDAIVCNSAIWQLDMPAVCAAAARVLRAEGRFVFNVGRQFIMLPFTEDEASRSKPSLGTYAEAIAILDYDYVPPMGRRGRLLSREIVETMLTDSGLRLETFEILSYQGSQAQHHAWLRVPVFANNILYGLPYEQQVEIIDKAFERVDPSLVESTRWACFVGKPI